MSISCHDRGAERIGGLHFILLDDILQRIRCFVTTDLSSYHLLMQSRRLFRVTERFTIHNRGIVLVPGIIPIGNEQFQIGDKLQLRFNDGTSRIVTISGLDTTNPAAHGGAMPVLLSEQLTRQEVPVDTEVWSVPE